jgi:hypothetical protein
VEKNVPGVELAGDSIFGVKSAKKMHPIAFLYDFCGFCVFWPLRGQKCSFSQKNPGFVIFSQFYIG